MFKTPQNQLSIYTGSIYKLFIKKFGHNLAKQIVDKLELYRTYNIKIVGPLLDKSRRFTEKITTNFLTEDRTEGTIVFPTPNRGKIAFNISESKYDIKTLDAMIDDGTFENFAREWKNIDVFFVFFPLLVSVKVLENCAKWIECIRNLKKNIPIILVGVKNEYVDNTIQTEDIVNFQSIFNVPYAEISDEELYKPFVELQSLLKTYIRNVLPDIPREIKPTQLLLGHSKDHGRLLSAPAFGGPAFGATLPAPAFGGPAFGAIVPAPAFGAPFGATVPARTHY